jgi:hypothetical protein
MRRLKSKPTKIDTFTFLRSLTALFKLRGLRWTRSLSVCSNHQRHVSVTCTSIICLRDILIDSPTGRCTTPTVETKFYAATERSNIYTSLWHGNFPAAIHMKQQTTSSIAHRIAAVAGPSRNAHLEPESLALMRGQCGPAELVYGCRVESKGAQSYRRCEGRGGDLGRRTNKYGQLEEF